jgi:hypothetical protein
MTSKGIFTLAFCFAGSVAALAQNQPPRLPPPPANPPAPSVQAPADPGYAALIAMCKTPPAGRGGGGGRGAAGRAGGAPAPAPGVREYKVEAIPGVIAAGQQWKFLWQEVGNNGDGIVGTDDGALLLAQNDNSKVLKLDKDGKTSVAYSDTHTGGALSMNKKKAMFIVERGLRANVTQLTPQRKVLADSYQGEPLDCIGGVINDLTADSKGGVYFTMGGVYYADPKGVVTKYGNTTPNGIVLSADEKTLYATNGPAIAAFDVQPNGSLTNQREFAKLAMTVEQGPARRPLWIRLAPYAALTAMAAAAVAFVALRPGPRPQVTRFQIHAPTGSTLPLGTPAVSPDGRTIAYTMTDAQGVTHIHVRPLDRIDTRVLPGTENAIHPFWFADGRSLDSPQSQTAI